MDTLTQDLRYALHTLARARAFTAAAVLCLALGIGANTTVFSLVHSLLIRPLPFPDAERLVAAFQTEPRKGNLRNSFSAPDYLELKARSRSYSDLGAYYSGPFTLEGPDGSEYLDGGIVTANVFRLLGVAPALGRAFTDDEDVPGRDRVVIIGDGLWRRRFGGDPAVIGRTVTLNGRSRTIVGVMPPRFAFPNTERLWVPASIGPEARDRGSSYYVNVLGRLAPGVTVDAASAEAAAIARRLEARNPATNAGLGARVRPLIEQLMGVDVVRPMLLLFMGAVSFVLLIACANVANLLLARATSRRREVAVRTALGASRGRIVRQLLTESVVVALLGGALGALLAVWGVSLLPTMIPVELPFWARTEVDVPALAFTVALSLFTGIAFGLAPALHAAGGDVQSALKDGGRGATDGARGRRLRAALVVSEVALSLVLVVGATLMIRSILQLQRARLGFDPDGVLTARVALAGPRYESAARRAAFLARALERIRALPGVRDAAAVTGIPLDDHYWRAGVQVDGRAVPTRSEPRGDFASVSGDYFATLGVPLLAGRAFTARELVDSAAAPVTIVNATLSRRLFPGESPLGRRIRPAGGNVPWLTIVGVAADVRQHEPSEPTSPQAFIPFPASPRWTMALVVRTRDDAGAPAGASLVPALRRAAAAVDPGVPVYAAGTMREAMNGTEAMWMPRFFGGMLGAFALLALLLAAVGIYGVMSYAVSQRTHEIGVRMALGASRGDVLRLTVGRGMTLTLVGVAAGVALALGVTRLLAGFLYGVTPSDPASFAAVALFLGAVALLASYLPARRAAAVDPVVALRAE